MSVSASPERDIEAVRFITAYTDRNGCPPSVRVIGDHFGLRGGGQHIVVTLLKRGFITRTPTASLSIAVTEAGRQAADLMGDAQEQRTDPPAVRPVAAQQPQGARQRSTHANQAVVLEYVASYVDQHGHGPSAREVGEQVGLTSGGGVHLLNLLLQAGMLIRTSRKRDVQLTDAGREALGLPPRPAEAARATVTPFGANPMTISHSAQPRRRAGDRFPLALRYIAEYMQMHGYAPSVQEIGQRTGGAGSHLVRALTDEGLITRTSEVRSIRLTDAGRQTIGLPPEAVEKADPDQERGWNEKGKILARKLPAKTARHKREMDDRQKEVLRFFADFLDAHSYPPNHREIGANFGLTSGGGANLVRVLLGKGLLERSGAARRNLLLTTEGMRQIETLPCLDKATLTFSTSAKPVSAPAPEYSELLPILRHYRNLHKAYQTLGSDPQWADRRRTIVAEIKKTQERLFWFVEGEDWSVPPRHDFEEDQALRLGDIRAAA